MRPIAVWVIGHISLCSCSVLNDVDVCDRALPDARTINVRTDGDQRLGSAQSLVSTSDGRGFLVFASRASASGNSEELRLMRLDGNARAISTCGFEREHTLWPESGESGSLIPVALAVDSGNPADAALAVWSTADPIRSVGSVFAGFVDSRTGCRFLSAAPQSVSAPEPEAPIVDVTAARTGVDEFLLLWIEGVDGLSSRVFARSVHWKTALEFLPLEDIEGQVARDRPALVSIARLAVRRVEAVSVPEGVAIATLGLPASEPSLTIVDSAMRTKMPPFVVDEGSDGFGSSGADITLAFDGTRLLLLWVRVQDDGRTELRFRMFDAEGNPLSHTLSPTGDAVALSARGDVDRYAPALTALPQGGFALAWIERRRNEEAAPRVMLAILTAHGELRFLNQACDRAPIEVTEGTREQLLRSAVTALPDGTLLLSWSGFHPSGVDVSGTSIEGLGISPRAIDPSP